MGVQAGLRLCWSQIKEDRIPRVEAQVMFYIHIVLCELFSGISCDFESSGDALGWCY